jgi:hypothetical protein
MAIIKIDSKNGEKDAKQETSFNSDLIFDL